MKKKHNSVVL
jgi:pumilio RNA-binding family